MLHDNAPAATPAEPAPSTSAAPGGPPAALTAPPGTALQIAQMLAAGTIDTKQAGKLARAGNSSMLDIAQALTVLRAAAEPQEPDLRSPEVKALDAALPVAKLEEFVIRASDFGPEPTTAAERAQFDANARTARTWLHAAGLPREVGNSLVTTIAKVARDTQSMNPAELETRRIGELKKMQRIHGEKLTERLEAYDDMIDAIEQQHQGVTDFLGSRGIGASALIVNMLLNHAPIFQERRGRSGTAG